MKHTLCFSFDPLAAQSRARAAWAAWIALLLLLCAFSARAATPAVAEEGDPTKAVFIDDPSFGKDPFFPRSTRRGRSKVVAPTNVVAATTIVADDFTLKGLSGSPERRLAIINNYTFQVGEESVIKAGGVPVKVRCIEIRERSVIVSINGITKELKLRPKL